MKYLDATNTEKFGVSNCPKQMLNVNLLFFKKIKMICVKKLQIYPFVLGFLKDFVFFEKRFLRNRPSREPVTHSCPFPFAPALRPAADAVPARSAEQGDWPARNSDF